LQSSCLDSRSCIDTSIHLRDRLLLVLSAHSFQSRWVHKEIETAFEKEDQQRLSIRKFCDSCIPEGPVQGNAAAGGSGVTP
jgi:hypothetical protein